MCADEIIFINNKVKYSLPHHVVTWDVDRDISTAYCC